MGMSTPLGGGRGYGRRMSNSYSPPNKPRTPLAGTDEGQLALNLFPCMKTEKFWEDAAKEDPRIVQKYGKSRKQVLRRQMDEQVQTAALLY